VFLAAIAGGMPADARMAGRYDATFAAGGVLVRDLPGDDDAFDSVVVQPDGRVLVSSPAGIVRLDVSGAIDPSFGGGGVAGRLALQPDGRVVVLARDGLRRLRADGTLDTGFGHDGVAPLVDAFLGPGGEATALALQPNGKVVG
jgi:hypothetical protein